MSYESDNEGLSVANFFPEQENHGDDLLKRCIIHLDVDCFYCQCEEALNPSLRLKPLAIGQKHIIVTSNHVARKMGVHKLMGREQAKRICPSLIILEGSDLEPYRNASKKIYKAFRLAVKKLHPENPTCKGGMDEYFADVSLNVNGDKQIEITKRCKEIWVFGDKSGVVEVKEDQSGDKTVSEWKVERNNYHGWGTLKEREECAHKLLLVASIAQQIQNAIKLETGFSTTVGVSTSPMLAKLVSDLKKPNSCNVLYPWRSVNIVQNMPLRKIPDLGSKKFAPIVRCLQEYNGCHEDGHIWTCRHLLNIPLPALENSLIEQGKKESVSNFCRLLVNRCKGIDTKLIIDDKGGLSKQISVENSFVRGSLISMEGVRKELGVLVGRLLRLLIARKEESHQPSKAYPTLIRVTIRKVDQTAAIEGLRTPCIFSRQRGLDGKQMMRESSSNEKRIDVLKKSTETLLQTLGEIGELNITRLNLAVLNFQDIKDEVEDEFCKNQVRLSSFFQKTAIKASCTSKPASCKIYHRDSPSFVTNAPGEGEDEKMNKLISSKEGLGKRKQANSIFGAKDIKKNKSGPATEQPSGVQSRKYECPSGMDPSVFDALPPEIAREVIENHNFRSFKTSSRQKRVVGIRQYLRKR